VILFGSINQISAQHTFPHQRLTHTKSTKLKKGTGISYYIHTINVQLKTDRYLDQSIANKKKMNKNEFEKKTICI